MSAVLDARPAVACLPHLSLTCSAPKCLPAEPSSTAPCSYKTRRKPPRPAACDGKCLPEGAAGGKVAPHTTRIPTPAPRPLAGAPESTCPRSIVLAH